MVGSDLQIALTGGGTKTLNDIESVVFTDRTVHIVGADGYATFKEAIEQGHIDDLDWVYGSTASNITLTTEDRKTLFDTDRSDFYKYKIPPPTEDPSDPLSLTDFYTYNG
jgi:hypothetical protein